MRTLCLLLTLCLGSVYPDAPPTPPAAPAAPGAPDAALAAGEKRISEYILSVLQHFKQPDPVGLPGADVPDPFPVPDTKQSFGLANMHFKDMALYGISKFRILNLEAEIGSMEMRATMLIDKLQVLGNYTMASWLSRSAGPFTVNLTRITVGARASLGVQRTGSLRAQDINIDIKFANIDMDFKNLGFFGSMFQGMINSIGSFLFDSIKPYILKEAYTKIRSEIDAKLDDVAGDVQFPNSISPLDMIVADARKRVRDLHMDPYRVKDYNATVSVFSVALSGTWLTGVSSFYRVGNITMRMENNTAIADFEVGTQRLDGRTQWDVSAVAGLLSRAGTASFSVEYVSARAVLAQPMDTRRRPEFRGLELEVGNIQVRCDGAGTLDYAIEFAVNVLPNLLRYQIMDALEGPLKEKVQQELSKLDVEEAIMEQLPKMDEMQAKGLKLSALRDLPNDVEVYDDDEFFNF